MIFDKVVNYWSNMKKKKFLKKYLILMGIYIVMQWQYKIALKFFNIEIFFYFDN